MAAKRNRPSTIQFGRHRLIWFEKSKNPEVLDADELVANGVDPEQAKNAAGRPIGNAFVTIGWNPQKPIDDARLERAVAWPTDREITQRAEVFHTDTNYVSMLSGVLKAQLKDGQELSEKGLKVALRDNAKAELLEARHQLTGLTSLAARQLVEREMTRINAQRELAKTVRALASAEEIAKSPESPELAERISEIITQLRQEKERLEKILPQLRRQARTDIFILDENSDGEKEDESGLIPLYLKDEEGWQKTDNVDGKAVTTRHQFWRIRPPRGEQEKDGALHRVCRAGRGVDDQYATLVYYRRPTKSRRGAMVAVPMKLLQSMQRAMYKSLAEVHSAAT